MTFVVKREPVNPHYCNTPVNTVNKPLIAGDIWKCDDKVDGCGRYSIWKLSDTSNGWSTISRRRAQKETKRWAKGKPFKQRCGHDMGPG